MVDYSVVGKNPIRTRIDSHHGLEGSTRTIGFVTERTMKLRIQHYDFPQSVYHGLVNRDAALWIGEGFSLEEENLELLAKTISLPWQIVLCELTSSKLTSMLQETSTRDSRLNRRRGFAHLVASDPEGVLLPPRSLPVYLLNGRDDATAKEESSNLTSRSALRRRLNMLSRLEALAPRMLVVLASGGDQPFSDLIELWDDGFRSLLVVHSDKATDAVRLDEWLSSKRSAPTLDHCAGPFPETIGTLLSRVLQTIPEDRIVVRIKSRSQGLTDLDITECELIEQPLLDRYEVLQPRDLIQLAPDELSQNDLKCFFERSSMTWKPFAAGVPWQRNMSSNEEIFKALTRIESGGSEHNCVRVVTSESGAGGTTRVRTLAFETAQKGYPTLVARPVKFRPTSTELEKYFYNIRQKFALSRQADPPEQHSTRGGDNGDHDDSLTTPWVIVYDVQHWESRYGDIALLARSLARSGQRALILAVTGTDIGDELSKDTTVKVIDSLSHELPQEEILSLGNHLNLFLRPLAMAKTEHEWRYFADRHRPRDLESHIASFWITLEFWLKGQIDLSESVQDWVARQFKNAELAVDAKQLLLEIAALTIERQPYPEGLLPASPDGEFPYSFTLSEIREKVPALALICDGQPPRRQWALAHDLIGRYLVNAVYFDRSQLERIGLSEAEDPVSLRLLLLRRIATRVELGRKNFIDLANQFATNILKLGSDGNLDFSRYWRQVIDILENMHPSIWETSRTFNHHVAITRRRIATTVGLFHLTLDEKREQLLQAVEHLEYAINRLERQGFDDESDLNLLNSLSLAYQNLATVENERGASAECVKELRDKATEAARQAQRLDPNNTYVLETFARNLLQSGTFYSDQAAACAAEALGYLYQAITLDRSLLREQRLIQLASEAVVMLKTTDSINQLEALCASGNPLGFLGKALLLLTTTEERLSRDTLTRIPKERLKAALAILDQAPARGSSLLLRFRYDLVTISDPLNFEHQLNLLEDLEGTGYQMPMQLQLEHAILLHQRNRHLDANKTFRFIRQELRTQDTYVDVPQRLRWLISEDGKRRLCNARVFETRDFRSQAKVRELQDSLVPFIPQEFGSSRMPSGMAFTCSINFGAMGPFIKPPQNP